MSATAFRSAPKAVSRDTCRSGEVPGDWERWPLTRGESDDLRQERLRRGLRRARQEELTERQRQVLALCYDQGLSVTEAARHLGVCPSTVSRTLRRAQERLRRYLQYTL